MKVKNHKIFSNDTERLGVLRDEYILLGFDVKLEPGCLTVFALKRKKKKPVAQSKD